MLHHYLTLSLKVLLRRPFFTFISLFGIAVTLLVLMVATAMFDHSFGPGAPEPHQARTVGVYRAIMYGEHVSHSGQAGFKLFDRYARDLPGVERLSIFSSAENAAAYVAGSRVDLGLKRTDGEFWQILDFTFLEGRPFSAADVSEARFVAVISEATRAKLLDGKPATGRTIEVGGQRFQVVGVVDNVSRLRETPWADVWVPHTTSKSAAYRDQLMGEYYAIALARDPAQMPKIREEFNARVARVELPDPKLFTTLVAPFETRFDSVARHSPVGDPRDAESQGWKARLLFTVLALLFMLLPALNLINVNVSRIMERASEIGVRKAFGASSRTLVGQFVAENLLLTLVGAAIGLLLSALVLQAINASGLIAHSRLGLNLRVFGWGLLLAVAFGLMSGVYPAWRMSRLHPVDALKGGPVR